MNSRINVSAIEKIQQLAMESDSYAYMVIDEQGRLLEKDGELSAVALPDWQIGENIMDTTLFLLGNLPMTTDYESINCYELSENCIIDAHLFNDENSVLIILIDRTQDLKQEARLRQDENEQKLRKRYSRESDTEESV